MYVQRRIETDNAGEQNMTYKYREEVRGLHTVQTVEWALRDAANPRAKAFSLLNYSRLTDEARAFLQEYVKREG